MSIEAYLTLLKQYSPYLILTAAVWLTYSYSLFTGFVSDDHPAFTEFDGKLQGYEYGMLWRWLRFQVCGGLFPSKQKLPNGTYVPQGKVPLHHHILSLFVFNLTVLVTFIALKPIIGEQIALLSILILIVHPCTTQGVAWISGVAYPLSLFWISLTVILMQYFYAHQTLNNAIWAIPLFIIIQFFAIHAIFATTALVGFLLLFLGYWQFAILGFIVAGAMCFDQIRKTVQFRVKEFKNQNMGDSTVFSWRKIIVAMKTFAYYLYFSLFPIRMGLYHTWGFHYEKSIERTDWRFWVGLFSLITLGCIFFNTTLFPIKLAILWYIIFSIGFWNFITAQQFVTERYIMVANLGLGILISTLFQAHMAIYMLIFGLYLCRTWTHLPTYDNELRFYQSNHWNFQKSEVALGNLGCTYLRLGMEGHAKECWLMASSINPDYDVPWINLFYQARKDGFVLINHGQIEEGMAKLKDSMPYIEKALKARVCHFPGQWRKEFQELNAGLMNPVLVIQEEFRRLLGLKEKLRTMLAAAKDEARIREVGQSIENNDKQIQNILNSLKKYNFTLPDTNLMNKYNCDMVMEKITRR